MENILIAVLYGAVQGVAEFLPISSSGHLAVFHRFLPLATENELAFDVALHFATLAAVVFYFWKDIVLLFTAWLSSLRGQGSANSRLAWLIILATIPAAVFGKLLDDWVENELRSPFLIAFMLAAVGALFLLAERKSSQESGLENLDWRKSFLIGLAQALALVPGTSRSGITIIAGMFSGLKREAAVRFSFLLMLPITFGAGMTKAPEAIGSLRDMDDVMVLSAAFLSAAVFGLLSVRFLVGYARGHRLDIFAYYRFALSALIVVLNSFAI